ncbi:hypothetical protein RB653_006730 [Dictyostelium firmibasis]|uniref:Uncharacterized protein n=1 Tax=Dictyostelium firmibasis TaxID=79012 RepID=A0AAN7TKN9_9MYCE
METIENQQQQQQISKEFVTAKTSSPIPIKKSPSHQSLFSTSILGSSPTSHSSSGSSTPTSSSPSNSWTPEIFSSLISSLANWLKGIEENKVTEEEYKFRENELWNDWEWILSTTEEFLIKQNQTENARVLGELDILKRAASNLKVKPIFINRANRVLKEQFSQQQDIDLLSTSPLDPNKRLGIITTIINTLEVEWLNYIKQKYFYDDDDTENNKNDDINDNKNNYENNNTESTTTQFELAEDGWEDNLNNSVNSTSSSNSNSTTNNNNNKNENNNNNNDKEDNTFENSNINLEETKEVRKIDTIDDMIVLKKNINKITWEQFMENFKGSKYSKGVHGRMKDLGWQASHGVDGSLNSRVIGDVTWSIWNTLSSAVKSVREITTEESNELIDIICLLQPMLVKMWLDTIKNSRIGVMNEGIVVAQWKQEESKKKKKQLELKKSGKLDKYTNEKVKILDHERKEISQIRLNLEKKLKLKVKEK